MSHRKSFRLVIGLAYVVWFSVGCTQGSITAPDPPVSNCSEEGAAPTDPGILETLPLLREFREFEDPAGDFLLDQPLFEESFDATGAFERARIPSALDMRTILVGPEGESAMFQILTASSENGGPTLRELLTDGRHTAQVGILIDSDRNGLSDYLVTTTAAGERGLLVTRTVNERVADIDIRLGESELTLFVPLDVIGERFEWVAFTGYTPIEDAYFRTSLEELFFLPVVDAYHPGDVPSHVGFSTTYSGTGKQCFVTTNSYSSCPAQGNPTLVQVPNSSYQGVLLYDVRCNGRGYDFWCLSQSFFGKHVYDGAQEGWIAKCPYPAGCNSEHRWDQNADGLVDKVIHTVFDSDGNCGINPGGPHIDADADGKLDSMVHTYLYSSNQVTSCNRNRDYATNAVVSQDCRQPQAPYANPGMVPGSLP
jgi:hypothetical protein